MKRRPGRPATGRALTPAERMRRYRSRRRAAGLRTRTVWASEAAVPMSPGLLKHKVIEARSLAMHCLIARKIATDQTLLAKARRNVARWSSRYGDIVPRPLQEWQAILEQPWPEVAALLVDPGETAARLRQSSPFAGVLTASERRAVYDAFGS